MKIINLQQSLLQIASYALPISAGSLVNIIANFIAMRMVAQLGHETLAAGALGSTTYLTIITFIGTSLYAISILISHSKGQNTSDHDIGAIVKNGIWVAVVMAIPASCILWHADIFLHLFGQNNQLIAIATPYFHYAALALFPAMLVAVMTQFQTGIGNPKFALIMSSLWLPFVILLSYCFILGKFGFPRLGLAGVTCASFIVQLFNFMSIIIYLYYRKIVQKYQLFSTLLTLDWLVCKKIITLGLPIGAQFAGELGAMTIATYFIGHFGAAPLAASQIVLQYSMFDVMITLGISQAAAILISHAYGKNDSALIKKYLFSAFIVFSVVYIFTFLAFIFFPHSLINLFIGDAQQDNADVIKFAVAFFAVASVVRLIDGARNIFSGVLRGLHDSSVPMKFGIGCLWFISLPVSYLVGITLHGGPVILRIGFGSGFLIASILLFIRIRKKLSEGIS